MEWNGTNKKKKKGYEFMALLCVPQIGTEVYIHTNTHTHTRWCAHATHTLEREENDDQNEMAHQNIRQ